MLQYIGARYVPIFYQNSLDPTSSEWEPNVTYEPMVWVSLPNGYMYISKKKVPANIGTPAQNGEYWLEAGQYNAYIQSLQDQIDNIDQVELPAIDSRVTELEGDDWIVISDSYGGLYPDVSGTTFIEYMRAFTGRTSDNLIGLWKNGIGFCKQADSKVFLTLLSDYAGVITQDKKKAIKKIIVAAGRNDYEYTKSQIVSAIDQFASYARTEFPNAELMIAFIANGNNTSNGTRAQQYTVYEAFNEQNYMRYLGGCEAILKNTDLMAADFIHPNGNGRIMIARYLLQAIETGSAHVYYPRHKATITITLADTVGAYAAQEFYEEIVDGKLVLSQDTDIGGLDMNGSSLQANGGHIYALGISDAKYIKFPVNTVKLPMSYSCMKTSSSTGMDTDGIYTAEISHKTDGNLYLSTFGQVAASPYNRTITYILFGRDTVEIPAVLA